MAAAKKAQTALIRGFPRISLRTTSHMGMWGIFRVGSSASICASFRTKYAAAKHDLFSLDAIQS
jgi:hypothetical protein